MRIIPASPFAACSLKSYYNQAFSVAGEPKMKIQDPISKQTLMKSNAQLRREDQDDAP
jgi:hypothetical protein